MKTLITFLICISIGLNLFAQDFVSQLEFSRTFNIRKDNSTGTCFLVSHNQGNYWITAKHVLGNIKNN